jgi:hypothetical protein
MGTLQVETGWGFRGNVEHRFLQVGERFLPGNTWRMLSTKVAVLESFDERR